ncbi:MAG: T9SS type A sorting domain-containing protein [Flavobacterium sp.]|nr:MAG: T9SS type A sorting domain-containing protein [Flavobacterium sp.]
MKKPLLLIIFLISFFGSSQQVLMKRTPSQLFFLCLANGTSIANTCGSNNFDPNYNSYWIAIEYSTVTMGFTSPTPVTIANETVGSTTFNWLNPGQEINSTAITNPNPVTFKIKSVWADCNGDTNKDALYITVDFPMLQTNGFPIPVGQLIRLLSPTLNSYPSNTPMLDSTQLWFEWDGAQWNQYNFSNMGYPIVDGVWRLGFLSVNEEIKKNNTITIYPNPAGKFIKIQTKENDTKVFGYKIVDMVGRIVKDGTLKSSDQINIENLTSGNYIMQLKTEKEILVEKFIKD